MYTPNIGNNELKRGKGLWKFNSSLLHDQTYVQQIKDLVKKYEEEFKDHDDKGLAWEVCKLKIRSFSVPYCVKKKRDQKQFKLDLETKLHELEKSMDQNVNSCSREEYISAKSELEKIEKHEANGSIFRSKIKWSEDGERNTKFFLSLEKRNYTNKCITQIQSNDKTFTKQKDILNEGKQYFNNLYKETLNENSFSYKNSVDSFLQDNNLKSLSEVDKKMCEQEITDEDILNSLKDLNSSRIPGTDGLPSEFY
jgi:hypothetical protein